MRRAEPLVLSVLSGPADAGEIWARLYSPVSGMVGAAIGSGRACRSDPRLEDLVAEATYAALTNVCRYRHGFRGTSEGEARAWLLAVSRNAARREARRQARWWERHVTADQASLEALSDVQRRESPDALSPDEARALLARALPSPALRRLWLLRNRPGAPLSCAQIAALTGRTSGSVAVSLSRARRAIRRELLAAG